MENICRDGDTNIGVFKIKNNFNAIEIWDFSLLLP